MSAPSRPELVPPNGRLDSWKEIAAYLGRNERTVRRWEESEGLPVHRLVHEKRGSVYAYCAELDAWRVSRLALEEKVEKASAPLADLAADVPAATRRTSSHRKIWLALAAALILTIGFGVWTVARSWFERPSFSSIAVLPLRDLSGDPSQAYFSDGITEALISTLSQIHSLKVISRTTAMRYKGTNQALSDIGRELGVDTILEGSVQRAGERVRISTRLIRASTDSPIWSRDYERDVADVLRVEGELARSIASEIRMELTPDETRRLAGRRITPAALEAYFRGRYQNLNMNDHDELGAIRNFEEAIRLQPDFAAAYAGLASAWIARFDFGAISSKEAEQPARDAARKAIQLNPDLSDGHIALADLSWFDWDWKAGEKEYQRAIELDPNFPDARNDYSYFLIIQGRLPEAISQIERGAALDPLAPLMQVTFGLALLRARHYQEAEPHFRRALELDPQALIPFGQLLLIREFNGDPQTALNQLEQRVRTRNGDIMQSALAGRLYVKVGRKADARRVLANITRPGSQSNPVDVAALYLALGDKDRCFEWLTKAFEVRSSVLLLKTSPLFDSVREDARFQALLQRLGVPD